MAVHLIAQVEVRDADAMNDYVAKVGAVVERYGGRYVFRGPVVDSLEGDSPANVAAVVEFDDVDQLRRWYPSDEYAPLKALRHRNADATIVVVG